MTSKEFAGFCCTLELDQPGLPGVKPRKANEDPAILVECRTTIKTIDKSITAFQRSKEDCTDHDLAEGILKKLQAGLSVWEYRGT